MYEGEVTELTPCETENPMGGYGKTISHVIIGLKTGKGTKQLKVRLKPHGSHAELCCAWCAFTACGVICCKR